VNREQRNGARPPTSAVSRTPTKEVQDQDSARPGFVEWLLAQKNVSLAMFGRELASDPPRARNIRTLAELDATLDEWDAIPLVRRAVYGLWREYARAVMSS
jgi:hypothetical protein